MKLLITCPKFFGYEELIKDEAERLGYTTTLIDDRIGLDFLQQAKLRKNISTKKIGLKVLANLKDILKSEEYDQWLCINPEGINYEVVKFISTKVIGEKKIYCWDSINNKNNIKSILNLFDSKYSFDTNDCTTYNLEHIPLYYSNHYNSRERLSHDNNESIYLTGTVHSDRFKIIDTLYKKGFKIDYRLYSKNYLFTFYFFLKGVIPFKYLKQISYTSLSHKTVSSIYKKYNFILDISHPLQSGLTNRSLEVLASGCYLITTNEHIKEYEFYNKSCIFILKRDYSNINDLNKWMVGAKKNKTKINLQDYSLSNWLKKILN
jgi:hypothetical protein